MNILIAFSILLAVSMPGAASAPPPCATCHPQETARFLASPMGQSLGPPETTTTGRVVHAPSGSVIAAGEQGGRMVHQLNERGLTATYTIAYQIGRGLKGRTYVADVGGYLLESPASWYRKTGWDVSPGYESMSLIDFDRPVTDECLFCHAGAVKFADADGRRLAAGETIGAITCERCHGPSDEHVRRPSAKNIVNPARLTGAERDSVCEQCHLEGETRVLNPGKVLSAFRVGERLEQTVATYVYQQEPGKAVTQAEELAESKCVRSNSAKLWCGSCHDPHGQTADRQNRIRTVCVSCHGSLSKAAHPGAQTECVSCHMPARPTTNIAHVAATDHRIQRPGTATSAGALTGKVLAWREPAQEVQQRDLGLAKLQIGLQRKLQPLAQEGFTLLRTLPTEQLGNDPGVLSILELVLTPTDPQRAAAMGRRVVELKPDCAACATALAMACKQAGNLSEAERQFRRAIDLDPSLMEAYAQLALLYDEQKRTVDSRETIARFLKWNPRNIQFRLTQEH